MVVDVHVNILLLKNLLLSEICKSEELTTPHTPKESILTGVKLHSQSTILFLKRELRLPLASVWAGKKSNLMKTVTHPK